MEQTFFFVSGEPQRWFQDMKEAVVYALAHGLVLERVVLRADGTVSRMILTHKVE